MKYVIGNWKMYPSSLKEAQRIFSSIKKKIPSVSRAKVILCIPDLYMAPIVASAGKGKISIGGQDCHVDDEGARTGETSPRALRSTGATCVILGHSERRAMGETDEIISQKIVAALRNKLKVILCVGERERDERGEYFNFVSNQLRDSLVLFPKISSKDLIVAYEPIWAIGSKAKRAATPGDFLEMSILIRRSLTDYFGKNVAFTIPVLYGGSVDDRNAEGFLKEVGADGFLIGRASLDPEKLTNIIHLANTVK